MSDKNKILITTSVMLSLLGAGCISQIPARPVMAQAMEMVAKSADKIYETKDWKKIEAKWDDMSDVKASNLDEISKAVEEQKKVMMDLCEPLLKEGYLSKISAEAIAFVYGENVRSSLMEKVVLPRCYNVAGPGKWDLAGIDTRGELKKKLDLLEECHKNDSINEEIYTSVKKNINNRLNVLEHADKYWQSRGEGKCEEHPEEVDVILHLYDWNVGGIYDGKNVYQDLFEASEYIVKLEQRGLLNP